MSVYLCKMHMWQLLTVIFSIPVCSGCILCASSSTAAAPWMFACILALLRRGITGRGLCSLARTCTGSIQVLSGVG